MKALVILNDPPYGSERSYNGLRLAGSLAKQDGIEVKVFLAGDAASCAKSGQKVPQGYYNVQTMLAVVTRRGGKDRCLRHLHGRAWNHRSGPR